MSSVRRSSACVPGSALRRARHASTSALKSPPTMTARPFAVSTASSSDSASHASSMTASGLPRLTGIYTPYTVTALLSLMRLRRTLTMRSSMTTLACGSSDSCTSHSVGSQTMMTPLLTLVTLTEPGVARHSYPASLNRCIAFAVPASSSEVSARIAICILPALIICSTSDTLADATTSMVSPASGVVAASRRSRAPIPFVLRAMHLTIDSGCSRCLAGGPSPGYPLVESNSYPTYSLFILPHDLANPPLASASHSSAKQPSLGSCIHISLGVTSRITSSARSGPSSHSSPCCLHRPRARARHALFRLRRRLLPRRFLLLLRSLSPPSQASAHLFVAGLSGGQRHRSRRARLVIARLLMPTRVDHIQGGPSGLGYLLRVLCFPLPWRRVRSSCRGVAHCLNSPPVITRCASQASPGSPQSMVALFRCHPRTATMMAPASRALPHTRSATC